MIECVVSRRTSGRQTYLVARSRQSNRLSERATAARCTVAKSNAASGAVRLFAASDQIDGLFETRFRPSGMLSKLVGIRPYSQADCH